ncbi:hypothetical protein FNF29_08348 [Cafeteria roenbergensis]|uniref:Uncharacterized protein n=1 Tax=Cafeteria roenbergensis TaxID=33653 RepID=A0A5A8BZJ6_CAFRO|nr:hypothetical protein FNF29_08348 [Cafeteria roenbergensis]|eukprot:KAA0145905.1 hypothetical protein FNF29_08348 [Cafeteria roenbergensis]
MAKRLIISPLSEATGMVEAAAGTAVPTLEAKDNVRRRNGAFSGCGIWPRATVKLLVDRGADLEAKDCYSEVVLIRAAACGPRGHGEAAAGPGAQTWRPRTARFGATSLDRAALRGHKETVELLLDRGADPEAKDHVSAVSLPAAQTGPQGRHRPARDRVGDDAVRATTKTAVIKAAIAGHKDTMELLLDRGADLDAKDHSGNTALLVAADRGHKDTVELLLDRGADLEAKNSAGKNALALCASLGPCAEVLRSAERLQRWHRRRVLALWAQ